MTTRYRPKREGSVITRTFQPGTKRLRRKFIKASPYGTKANLKRAIYALIEQGRAAR